MRKNCGSDERFAKLVQEMVDILVNADKETLQIQSEAQKKISELKEVCRNEGGILTTAYTKSRRAIFNVVPPEYRLPTKEEFERIDQLSPANLSIYEATLLKDEKKLKKFLHAWQENGDDKRWKDYVKGSHPESAKRLNTLFDRAVKYLGNSSIDNFSANFNRAKEREIRATEIASLSASMLKDVSWLESTFTNGLKSSLVNKFSFIEYGIRGGTVKANIVGALPKIIELESQLIKLG
jgi:hypothetical protein